MERELSIVINSWEYASSKLNKKDMLNEANFFFHREPEQIKRFLNSDRFLEWLTHQCRVYMATGANVAKRELLDEAKRQRNLLKSPKPGKDKQDE